MSRDDYNTLFSFPFLLSLLVIFTFTTQTIPSCSGCLAEFFFVSQSSEKHSYCWNRLSELCLVTNLAIEWDRVCSGCFEDYGWYVVWAHIFWFFILLDLFIRPMWTVIHRVATFIWTWNTFQNCILIFKYLILNIA